MNKCGIDTTTFKAQSTRHAASSAVFRNGVKIDVIRSQASWSENCKVFNKFYNKPVVSDKQDFVSVLLNLKK